MILYNTMQMSHLKVQILNCLVLMVLYKTFCTQLFQSELQKFEAENSTGANLKPLLRGVETSAVRLCVYLDFTPSPQLNMEKKVS
jgi:hypothetical protein